MRALGIVLFLLSVIVIIVLVTSGCSTPTQYKITMMDGTINTLPYADWSCVSSIDRVICTKKGLETGTISYYNVEKLETQ
jgi:hypothetical protein